MASSVPLPLSTDTIIAGKLRIVRLLGTGGMASVYEVEHQLTRHRRALKLLHPEMLKHPMVVARFLREASAAGHIGNPHVVETFDAGTLDDGAPYIVMEMLSGEPLGDRFARDRRLPLADLADLVGQACEGVEAAHAVGIIHRDLKPDNLFLVRPERAEGTTFVKVLDFGISKFDPALTGGHGMTKEGVTIGTPYYMSPEQVNGSKDIDARADVYALGVILYEGAAGQRPFEAEALPLLSVLIHEGKPRQLGELRPDLPPEFIDVVHRAMATNPDDRYASARDLATDLAPFRASALDVTIPEGTMGVSPTGPPRAIIRGPSSRPPPAHAGARRGSSDAPAALAPLAAVTLASGDSKPPPRSSTAPPSPAVWEPAATTASGAARSVAENAPRSPARRFGPWVGLGALVLVFFATRFFESADKAGSTPAALVQTATAPSSSEASSAMTTTAAPSASVDDRPVARSSSDAGNVTAGHAVPSAHAVASAGPVVAKPASSTRVDAQGLVDHNPFVPAAKPSSSTRVDQKGLAGDNPYQ